MSEEIYVVTATDGNRFVSFKDGDRWVATKSGTTLHFFTEGYIIEWVKV